MGSLGENQNSTGTGRHGRTVSNRVSFRPVLYVPTWQGFLAEVRNPGFWNDAFAEMVFRTKHYDCVMTCFGRSWFINK